jgi:UDP-N-acetylmuramate dehydrogenase
VHGFFFANIQSLLPFFIPHNLSLLSKQINMLLKNHSLRRFNTFGIDVKAESFMILNSEEELIQYIKTGDKKIPLFILGGGSNLLLTRDLPYLVIKNDIKGKQFQNINYQEVLVTAGAGESWHDFVVWCLENDFGGIENLSLIPGSVGASPIQNIGAYGVELKDIFYQLEAIHLETGQKRIFTKEDCNFGYRDSIFKHELKGEFCITKVSFILTKRDHKLNINYGAIKTVLDARSIVNPSILDIHKAVIDIRQSKLPDPSEIGNAGSFFKNPEIEQSLFETIKSQYLTVPSYPGKNDLIKVPAGWLIEQCGWKGQRKGDAGCYNKQALILVNYGEASGKEIEALSDEIAASVFEKFKITLQKEVNIV